MFEHKISHGVDWFNSLMEKIANCGFIVNVNPTEKIHNGIVVIYPSWSKDQAKFNILLNEIAGKSEKMLPLYLYDIDNSACRDFENDFCILSHGKCEMYVIRNEAIVFKIETHDKLNPKQAIQELIESATA